MYRLNKQNPIVAKLMELDDAISEYFAQKHCLSAAESLQECIGSCSVEPGIDQGCGKLEKSLLLALVLRPKL